MFVRIIFIAIYDYVTPHEFARPHDGLYVPNNNKKSLYVVWRMCLYLSCCYTKTLNIHIYLYNIQKADNSIIFYINESHVPCGAVSGTYVYIAQNVPQSHTDYCSLPLHL